MRYLTIGLLLTCCIGVSAETFNGPVSLATGNAHDDKEPVIEFAGDISFSVKLYVGDFAGDDAIFAYTRVRNASDTERRYAFYAAFLDADGNLIAASRHTTTLKPGVDTQLGGLYSEVSAGQWKSVASYKFTVTEL